MTTLYNTLPSTTQSTTTGVSLNGETAIVDYWQFPAVIAPNNFQYKSLSNWACNTAIGCSNGCLDCYVPSVATNKLGPQLVKYGINNADSEWGNYVLLRPWNEKMFMASLRAAEATPLQRLKADGHRAVIFCSTTDPYQVIYHPVPARQQELSRHARFLVRRALELIRDYSTLNVRILCRSTLVQEDFDLFRSFGKRLVFGMSIPTMRDDLTSMYEPRAPSPLQRMATLRAAKNAGLHVFWAMAATYPESDELDFRNTLQKAAELDPVTIFQEPINIRAQNIARIESHARSLGIRPKTDVFITRETWQQYALGALKTVERIAGELGIANRLHLWPDKSLGSKAVLARVSDPDAHCQWLNRWWHRISEWPK